MAAKKYEYRGKQYTIAELAELDPAQVKAGTIRMRIRYGWPVDLAVETPNRKKNDGMPVCGATSWYDCFTCRFNDCIESVIYFKDNPFLTEHYL